ncbi:carboxypeptidase-like regulatory domain-containing protein [Paraflavitalea speifideaquila]|uniref:carboxypeptidase-like regulatory domain-containing protein n=1 Tax=Paraflavitalea speifideaquila TaxID=3076558 RepID=UPI0028EED0C0|nr:carboxypeptidase-like regulatory domain-containing protein [Paraflavitalea speifideiaquila]
MLKLIPLILLALTWIAGSAQTTITGKVKDAKGRLINGASIAIKDSYDGGTSDSTGTYRFKTTEKGDQTLLVTSIGFKLYEQKITLSGASLTIDIQLKEEPNELTAVVITAGTFEASDTKRTTVLNPIDIVTTASANADITSAIKTLPGAQQVGESEGLFVRGGTAQETKVFIDGTLVNNFFLAAYQILRSGAVFLLLFLKEPCSALAAIPPCMARHCLLPSSWSPLTCPTSLPPAWAFLL